MIRTSFFIASLMFFSPQVIAADNSPVVPEGGITTADPYISPEIHPAAWKTPINQISQVACHNCYEPEVFNFSLPEALDYIKAIELDIWDESAFLLGGGLPGNWYVRHSPYAISGANSNHNNCSGEKFLDDCLNDILLWSNSNPGHFPVTLFLDKKQSWSESHEGRAPKDLFLLLSNIFGDKLYLPKEQAELNNIDNVTPARWKWPTAEELKDRIIVIITGGNFIRSSNVLPFFSGNSTYNASINQIRTFDDDSTAFAGPYVFTHNDFKMLPANDDIKSKAVFLNSNYPSAAATLVVNYFNVRKARSRLLRLWKVDDHDFCSLLKFRAAYLAYYEFVQQDCRSYRIVPMGYTPDELVNGRSDK